MKSDLKLIESRQSGEKSLSVQNVSLASVIWLLCSWQLQFSLFHLHGHACISVNTYAWPKRTIIIFNPHGMHYISGSQGSNYAAKLLWIKSKDYERDEFCKSNSISFAEWCQGDLHYMYNVSSSQIAIPPRMSFQLVKRLRKLKAKAAKYLIILLECYPWWWTCIEEKSCVWHS